RGSLPARVLRGPRAAGEGASRLRGGDGGHGEQPPLPPACRPPLGDGEAGPLPLLPAALRRGRRHHRGADERGGRPVQWLAAPCPRRAGAPGRTSVLRPPGGAARRRPVPPPPAPPPRRPRRR